VRIGALGLEDPASDALRVPASTRDGLLQVRFDIGLRHKIKIGIAIVGHPSKEFQERTLRPRLRSRSDTQYSWLAVIYPEELRDVSEL
jgi:hypothetical protein